MHCMMCLWMTGMGMISAVVFDHEVMGDVSLMNHAKAVARGVKHVDA